MSRRTEEMDYSYGKGKWKSGRGGLVGLGHWTRRLGLFWWLLCREMGLGEGDLEQDNAIECRPVQGRHDMCKIRGYVVCIWYFGEPAGEIEEGVVGG